MALTKMSSALSMAAFDRSEPKQFVLSWTDYSSLSVGQDEKLARINGSIFMFDGIRVVRAGEAGTESILEVWTTQPRAMDPIRL